MILSATYREDFFMTAFVLGNGTSRLSIDPDRLPGPVYGCNALYRTHTPSVLVATDRLISRAIQDSGYSQHNRFYTRHAQPGSGAQLLSARYRGYSSGPNAVAIAAADGHDVIYLLGFDMAPSESGSFNNVYAGTEFYKPAAAAATYTGNWIRQLCTIFADFPDCRFVRVAGTTTADIAEFENIVNVDAMSIVDLVNRINTTPKDLPDDYI